MLFNFVVMQAIYLSLARGSAEPLEEALRRLPKIPKDTQWANFLRNHDELTLDKLTVAQREEVFAAFGPEPGMQLYGRGLRRRLAVDARRRPAAAAHALQPRVQPAGHARALLRRRDRDGREPLACPTASRCARRCSGRRGPSGGFSTAPASRLVRPLVDGAVRARRASTSPTSGAIPDSQLAFVRRLIRLRRETPELGWGTWQLVESRAAEPVRPPLRLAGQHGGRRTQPRARPGAADPRRSTPSARARRSTTSSRGRTLQPRADGSLRLALGGYGHRWLRVRRAGQRPRF